MGMGGCFHWISVIYCQTGKLKCLTFNMECQKHDTFVRLSLSFLGLPNFSTTSHYSLLMTAEHMSIMCIAS